MHRCIGASGVLAKHCQYGASVHGASATILANADLWAEVTDTVLISGIDMTRVTVTFVQIDTAIVFVIAVTNSV